MWFDEASKKRKRDYEREQILKHIKSLAERIRNEAKRPKALHPKLQEALGISVDERTAEAEHSDSEETNISAFKRLRFDTGLRALLITTLVMRIYLERDQIPYSDVQLREFFQHMRPKWSKWASAPEGQEELCGAAEAVLNVLEAVPEHSKPFLRPVNKRDAPDYYHAIYRLTDLGTIMRKFQNFQYGSKGDRR